MKQKYTIMKSSGRWILKEFAELDKDIMSLLCEETYDAQAVETAAKSGKESLIKALRTQNMYPPAMYADKIADTLLSMLGEPEAEPKDLFFDDKELFVSESEFEVPDSEEEIEEENEDVDVDDLLESDIGDGLGEKKSIKDMKSSIKVAEDDTPDADDAS